MMSNLTEWLAHSSLGVWVAGGLLAAAFSYGLKALPKFLAKKEGELLDAMLNADDPEDKALALALVKWAEAKVSKPNAGWEKYQMVEGKILAMCPAMTPYKEKIEALIEASVAAMKEELPKHDPDNLQQKQ